MFYIMRKTLLTICVAASAAMTVFGQTKAEYQWYKTLDITTTAAGKSSAVDAVAEGPNNTAYVGLTFGQATDATWGGVSLVPAGAEIATAYQKAWTVGRIDAATGDFSWHVSALDANVSNNSLKLAATPDGGVIMACNATFNSNTGAGAPVLMHFTDAKGQSHTVEVSSTQTVEGKSPYYGVVMKFSADGACEWTSTVVPTEFFVADKFDANVVAVNALAVDAEGRAYVGGTYKTCFEIGDDVVPFALNIGVEKDGKTYNNGDAFILRLGADGTPEAALCAGATAPYAAKEALQALAVDGDKLYTAVIVDGAGGEMHYSLFGVKTEVSSEANANVVYGVIDLNTFTCEKASALVAANTTAQPSHNAQVKNLQVAGDKLYISGCQTGAFTQSGKTIVESAAKQLQSETVAISTSTFEAVAAYAPNEASIGYDFYVIPDATGKVYTLGDQLTGSACNLYEFEADGTLVGKTPLAVGPTNLAPALFINATQQLLVPMYGKSLSSLPDVDVATPTYSGFRGFLTSYKLPSLSMSGISVADVDVEIDDAPVEYFSIQGIRIAHPDKGTLVIRRQGHNAVKQIFR